MLSETGTEYNAISAHAGEDKNLYKIVSADGKTVRTGETVQGVPVMVDRVAGERLWAKAAGDLHWAEQGAYAGPDAREAQPESSGVVDETEPLLFKRPATGPYSEAAHNSILEEAKLAVYGDREAAYGHPRDDFARIAALWSGYLYGEPAGDFDDSGIGDGNIDVSDVACMMALLKIARLIEKPMHRDSWVDIAGYAAAGARAVGVDE